MGLACVRNTAMKKASGDILAYFDADTVPERTTLEQMLGEYTDANVAGVGGQEIFSESSNLYDLWRNLFWRQTHGDSRVETAWMLMGLCSSYRKDVLLETGGFSEEYRTNGEDVDLGLRLTQAGYRLIYHPDIGVIHRRKDNLKSLISLVYRHSYWQSRAMRKNGIDPSFQMKKAFKWLAVSTASSMRRHGNIKLALVSQIACTSAIAGRVAEMVSKNRGDNK